MLRVRKIVEEIRRSWVGEEDLPPNFKLKESHCYDNMYYLYNFIELENYAFVSISNINKHEFFLSSYNVTREKSKGYGSILMKFIIAKACRENIKTIRLMVFRNNYIAMKLYTKFNFIEETPVHERSSNIATLILNLKNAK